MSAIIRWEVAFARAEMDTSQLEVAVLVSPSKLLGH